jgi:hypothetical protein
VLPTATKFILLVNRLKEALFSTALRAQLRCGGKPTLSKYKKAAFRQPFYTL